MYKTVRHGENSLQYTILPQTEEVLSNSGLKGKGRDYSPSIHVRRTNRKFALKFVLFIVLGVVVSIGFASIPIYSVLYARRVQHNHHEVTSGAPLPAVGQDGVRSRKKELKISPEGSSTLKTSLESSVVPLSTSTHSTISPTTVNSEKPTTPAWNMPALRSWKSSSSSTTIQPMNEDSQQIPLIGTPSGSVRLLDHYMSVSMRPWEKDNIIRATVTSEPITIRNVFRYYSRAFNPSEKSKPVSSTPKLFEDVLITTKGTTTQTSMTTETAQTSENSKLQDLKDTILSVDDDEEFKESLEVDEVFSLPPLKPDLASPVTDSDEVTVAKAGDGGWYGARWPFVDASSYFQWTVSDYELANLLM